MQVTLDQLASEFKHVERGTDRASGAVIKKGALVVKLAARKYSKASGGSHAPGASAFINFDMIGTTDAEIGYDKSGQGNLGAILEYGTARTGPKYDLERALDDEANNVEKYLEKAIGDLWR